MKDALFRKALVFGIVAVLYLSAIIVMANENYGIRRDETAGSISGYVYQVNGNPIAGATVEVIRQDEGGLWEATTESDGNYKVIGLPTGDYKVRAFKSGYAREYYDNVFYSDEAEIIHLDTPEDITGIDFSLTLGGSISGYVYGKEDGKPINGAHIGVRPSKYFTDAGFWTEL